MMKNETKPKFMRNFIGKCIEKCFQGRIIKMAPASGSGQAEETETKGKRKRKEKEIRFTWTT